MPEVEIDTLPGFAFAAATTSSNVLNGESGLTDQLASDEAALSSDTASSRLRFDA